MVYGEFHVFSGGAVHRPGPASTPAFNFRVLRTPDTLEKIGMSLEHEKETEEIGEQKNQCNTEIERLPVDYLGHPPVI